MGKLSIIPLFTFLLFLSVIDTKANQYTMLSPTGTIKVNIEENGGRLEYSVRYENLVIIKPSSLGMTFSDGIDFTKGLKLEQAGHRKIDETWEQPWGEVKTIQNKYNEYTFWIKKLGKKMKLRFRLFDDGIGFRYEVPDNAGFGKVEITDEITRFNMNAKDEAWWIGAYQKNSYEHLYQKTPLSQLTDTVHTPLTIETENGKLVSIHEAALFDYASMTLAPDRNGGLKCDLAPWPDGIKVKTEAPFKTPWRTIQLAENAAGLMTSYLILNLNEPSKIEDTSWITPGKYVGIWWEMHLKKSTWAQGANHGANTNNVKRYINFAAKYGFKGVLAEGWNYGWDGNWPADGSNFRFYEPVPDFDMDELSAYATKKGVKLISHHETGGDVANYLEQVEQAFEFSKKYNITTVKTGHVGHYLNGEYTHYGQFAVEYYQKVVELAAKYHIMLDVHEPVKPTGIRRTWPNMMTREGARGMEFDAWSRDGGNPPSHIEILPFTRLLGGPMDFTPGIFEMTLPSRPNNRSNMTLAKQLSVYVLIYSPLQMAADLPENYEGNPAFQFIVDVPTDWDITLVPEAKIGKYLTVVRKDRNSEDWYLGSATNEDSHKITVNCSFLEKNARYTAEIYRDAPDAHWKNNPKAIIIEQKEVNSSSKFEIQLAEGGGAAIRFKKNN